MAYKYIAYNAERQVVSGTIAVTSEYLAKEALQRSGYSLLSLKPASQGLDLRRQIPTLYGVKDQEVITFSRLLATLVRRGTTPLAALEIFGSESNSATFREVIGAVSDDLRQGNSLAEAMSRHPDVFPAIYCRMIKVGEQTGNLEIVLRQLADYMEKEKALLASVGRALVYPAIILLIAAGVITLLLTVTLPSLSELFAEFGGELPLPTRILVALTTFFNTYKLLLLGLILGGVVLAVVAMKKPNIRRRMDMLLLKMPLIGPIVTLREMTHFCRMMSICLGASLPIPEVLEMVVKTSRNRIVTEVLENVSGEILKGRRLSQPMAENRIFPRLLVQMVKVGEEAGTLGEDLKALAETYETEVDKKVTTVLSLMEPGLIVVLGLFVAFIAVSVIMPIYSLLGEI